MDSEGPSITCPSVIIASTIAGTCYATPSYSIGSWDNCAGSAVTQDSGLASLAQFPLGTTANTHRVTDGAGSTTTCSFDVIVEDHEAPVLTCPLAITTGTDAGACSAAVTFAMAGIVESCGVHNTTSSPTTGSAFNVGWTSVTQSVFDTSGNFASCEFNVTVTDTEAPTVTTCPGNIVENAASGDCNKVVTWTTPTFADNCLVTSVIQTGPASGSTFSIGSATVTYTASDAAGHQAVCTFNVTVHDVTPPVITCPSNTTVGRDAPDMCNATVTYTAPVGTDACAVSTTMTHGLVSGSVFMLGQTAITYAATDSSGNTASCTFVVKVLDDNNPQITCPANISVSNDAGQCGANVTYSAPITFDCVVSTLGSVSAIGSGNVFGVGSHTEVYYVENMEGSNASCWFVVAVADTELPTITCPANMSLNNDAGMCGAVVSYTAPTGADNCGGSNTSRMAGVGAGGYVSVGVPSTEEYSVTDASGNAAACHFTVTVADAENPTITCPSNVVVNNDAGLCSAVVWYGAVTASDNCGSTTVAWTSGLTNGSAFPVGMTTVVYTATDSAMHTSTCQFTVTVHDAEAPMITCPTSSTVGTDSGVCTNTYSFVVTSSDNCAGSALVKMSGPSSGDALGLGATSGTWNVTDAVGLWQSCSFTVTVEDQELPQITCPAVATHSNDAGLCSAVVTYNVMHSDNCPGASVWTTSAYHNGSSFPVGMTIVGYNVTDGAGSTVSCPVVVTVQDSEVPVISCPSNVSVNNAVGQCGEQIVEGAVMVTDNCAGAGYALSSGAMNGSFVAVGTNWSTYVATDAAGLTAQCTVHIVVHDTELPTIACPASFAVDNSAGQCSQVVTYSGPTYGDNCGGSVLTLGGGPASGATVNVGVAAVSYTVQDASGNSMGCGFNVTVNDAEAPLISEFLCCPGGGEELRHEAVQCCAVLCCAVLCCAVYCIVVLYCREKIVVEIYLNERV